MARQSRIQDFWIPVFSFYDVLSFLIILYFPCNASDRICATFLTSYAHYLFSKLQDRQILSQLGRHRPQSRQISPCLKQAGTVSARYCDILLWVVLLLRAVAKILSWNFHSAVNFFLGYKYYFCLLLILESIFFLSLFLYVKELCLFPGKKSRVAPWAAIITNSQVTFSWQISLY